MTGTIDTVPNQPKTKVSTFRIPPELKLRVQVKAAEADTDLTEIVLAAFLLVDQAKTPQEIRRFVEKYPTMKGKK